MPTIVKLPSGSRRAKVRRHGVYRNATFSRMKNLTASREVSSPNEVKSFAASGGEFDPKGLKESDHLVLSQRSVARARVSSAISG